MHSPVRPHPADFWPERDRIMMAISRVFTPKGDLDNLKEEILLALCRTAEIAISQFQHRIERIEGKFEALDAEQNTTLAEPPFRHLLKRYIQHVKAVQKANDWTMTGPFVMTVSPSDANLTPEEQGILLAIEREIILEMEHKERLDRMEDEER